MDASAAQIPASARYPGSVEVHVPGDVALARPLVTVHVRPVQTICPSPYTARWSAQFVMVSPTGSGTRSQFVPSSSLRQRYGAALDVASHTPSTWMRSVIADMPVGSVTAVHEVPPFVERQISVEASAVVRS